MSRYSRYFIGSVIAVFTLIGYTADIFAQEDTEFWFAAPRMLSGHNKKKEAAYHVNVFNPGSETATITINQPANSSPGNISKSMSVAAGEMQYVTLAGVTYMYPNPDSVSVPFDVVSQRGLHIVSDVPVECYFQVTKGNGEAYTLKGQNALGTEFVVAMQNKFNNAVESTYDGGMCKNSFSCVAIVATEDNTAVTITPTQNVTPSCNKNPINVTLDKGETYAFRACGTNGGDHPIGTLITSDKPIAVTYNDDSALSGDGADAIGEQLIPTALTGDEYVAVSNQTSADYLFLIGLEDGTTVTDNDGNSYSLSKGSSLQVSLSNKPALYLKGNKAFEVFQVIGVKKKESDNKNHELGGTILPQVSCTGSKNVSYGRVNKYMILNLVTRNDNTDKLAINGTPISSSEFKKLGTSNYSYYSKDLKDTYKEINITSTGNVFQMGVLDYKSGETATYGYFSNYESSADVEINGEVGDRYLVCRDNPLTIKINSPDPNVDLSKVPMKWYQVMGKKLLLLGDKTTNVVEFPKFTEADHQVFYLVKWEGECGTSSKRITIDVKDCTPPEEHPFTVGKCGLTVTFALGNLQYKPSTKEWRFADEQFTILGDQNKNISETYDDWIDLFGWGTGDNPTLRSSSNNDYLSGIYDISGTSHDWGANNISNGGGAKWRTLTREEWLYLAYDRENANKLWGMATVESVKGLFILPDDWVTPEGLTVVPAGNYGSNVYSYEQWEKLQKVGAIFLPAGGYRKPGSGSQSLLRVGEEGYYWSASGTDDGKAYELRFTGSAPTKVDNPYHRYSGNTIRLIKDINNIPYSETDEETETACDNYTWPVNGETYTTSGDYTYETTTAEGCKLTKTLHLTVNYSKTEEHTETACDNYTWAENGETYTTSGNYTYVTTTAEGCKLTKILHLTVNKSETDVLNIETCDSYHWDEANRDYTESTTDVFETTTSQGCPRKVTLHLIINKSETEEYTETACDSYKWAVTGETYTESDDYVFETTTDKGCKLTKILHLTVNKSKTEEETVSACDNYTWDVTGKTYTKSDDYTYETTTAEGCKLTKILHLTVNKSETDVLNVETCDSYHWEEANRDYTESTTDEFETTTDKGCKRTVKLNLTINKSKTEEYSETACDSFTWDVTGETYTDSDDYVFETTTDKGCKLTKILHLTINKSQNEELTETACDSYYWAEADKTYDKSGDYKYETTTAEGCKRTVILHLTVNYSEKDELTATACDEYYWEEAGKKYTQSGDYVFNTTTAKGCPRKVTLHLTIYESHTKTENVTLCPGYAFQVIDIYGSQPPIKFTTEGTHTAHISTYQGCDSTVIVNLKYYSNEPVHIYDTICEGEIYERNGFTYSGTGAYSVKLLTPDGCEYTETLHLQVNPVFKDVHFYDTICSNETYTWEGTIYNTTTQDTKTLKTQFGCDSVVTMHLKVWDSYSNISDYLELCEDEPFKWGDIDIAAVKPSDSNQYTYTFKSVHGCDSTVVMTLKVHEKYHTYFDATVCDNEPYQWLGTTYTFDGQRDITDTKTLTSIYGCDSVATMRLHFNETKQSEFSATICDNEQYTWNGKSYNTAGDHIQTLQTSLGCDSVVTLHLTLNPTFNIEWRDTFLTGNPITWEGTTYSTEGDYIKELQSQQGCDSIVTLHLTENLLIVNEVSYDEFCIEQSDNMSFTIQVATGYIDYAQLLFSEDAHLQKIRDTKVNINGNNNAITVNIPTNANAGIYGLQIDYYYRDKIVHTQNITFKILYPASVLLQKWNDFIGVQTYNYNGGYNFVAFEWYKDGEPLGQTGSYIYMPLEIGASYSALLTDENGIKLFTCPITAVDKDDIGLYPTVVRKSGIMGLHLTRPAQMLMYDATGKLISTKNYEAGEFSISAPQESGIYVAHIILDDNSADRTYKIVVK